MYLLLINKTPYSITKSVCPITYISYYSLYKYLYLFDGTEWFIFRVDIIQNNRKLSIGNLKLILCFYAIETFDGTKKN